MKRTAPARKAGRYRVLPSRVLGGEYDIVARAQKGERPQVRVTLWPNADRWLADEICRLLNRVLDATEERHPTMTSKTCKHDCGWYIENAQIMVGDDYFSLLPMPNAARREDKAVAVCNCGCGATRNVYLLSADFTFGKVRKPEDLY